MPWDFFREPRTGDWQFSGNQDYSGVTGEMLIQQRVAINLKIPRGSFVYDDTKSLGSRLYDLLHTDYERGLRDAPEMVREALESMEDIQIEEIQVVPDIVDPRQIRVRIKYHPLVPLDFTTAPEEGGIVETPFALKDADLFPPEPA
jgi:hypothetical protein